jgi:hypothetical protein
MLIADVANVEIFEVCGIILHINHVALLFTCVRSTLVARTLDILDMGEGRVIASELIQ